MEQAKTDQEQHEEKVGLVAQRLAKGDKILEKELIELLHFALIASPVDNEKEAFQLAEEAVSVYVKERELAEKEQS